MTDPSPAFHDRLCASVEAALGVDPGARDELLVLRAGDDQELLVESRKMVAMASEDDGAFGEDELLKRRQQLEAALDSASEMAAAKPGLEGWMPESIGPYSIDHRLGRGGTGVVFAAHQSTPDRAVALKVLHPAFASAESTHRLLLLTFDDALATLAALNAQQGEIAQLRILGGLTLPEVATELDLSDRTVQSDWVLARTWLQVKLAAD